MTYSFEENKTKGNSLFQNGEFLESIKYYNNCIELEPSNPVGYSNKAMSLIKLHQYHDAIRCCKQGLAIIENTGDRTSKIWTKLHYRLKMADKLCGENKSVNKETTKPQTEDLIDLPIEDVTTLPPEFAQL